MISMVPRDSDGISAQAPYRYFLGLIVDQPPELEMKLAGIGTAVTPIAKIPITAVVTDDYGVRELTITVSPDTGEGEGAGVYQVSPTLDRDGNTEIEVDIRDTIASGQLVELNPGNAIHLIAEASDYYDLNDTQHVTRGEVYRLEVVSPADLLAILERRELALRARLEQTIDEMRSLRDSLDLMRRQLFSEQAESESDPVRRRQIRLLRVQQSGLQASKTSEELTGIAVSLDDILLEMVNNRVDSVDRRERIGVGVRDPLRQIVAEPLEKLREQIGEIEGAIDESARCSRTNRRVSPNGRRCFAATDCGTRKNA